MTPEDGENADSPPLLLQLAELRSVSELLAFRASRAWFRMLARGDGHPVLVLPGFIADDASTKPLRDALTALGHTTYGWELGRNVGPMDHILDGMEERLVELATRHDEPVSVVGWSLGGIYARELARDIPDAVQVVTLGSPFRLRPGDRSAVSGLADALAPVWRQDALRMAVAESERPRLTVPSTAVYTRTDGIVRWHRCIDEVDDQHENVEVYGSHCGLGFNPSVMVVVADRLAQPPGEWRPFRPPCAFAAWYPRPVNGPRRDERLVA